jgi:hypothetical protein
MRRIGQDRSGVRAGRHEARDGARINEECETRRSNEGSGCNRAARHGIAGAAIAGSAAACNAAACNAAACNALSRTAVARVAVADDTNARNAAARDAISAVRARLASKPHAP